MTAEKKDAKVEKTKHKVICASSYYALVPAGEINKRDAALALLFDEFGDKIVSQVNDVKSGDIKFVVKT